MNLQFRTCVEICQHWSSFTVWLAESHFKCICSAIFKSVRESMFSRSFPNAWRENWFWNFFESRMVFDCYAWFRFKPVICFQIEWFVWNRFWESEGKWDFLCCLVEIIGIWWFCIEIVLDRVKLVICCLDSKLVAKFWNWISFLRIVLVLSKRDRGIFLSRFRGCRWRALTGAVTGTAHQPQLPVALHPCTQMRFFFF